MKKTIRNWLDLVLPELVWNAAERRKDLLNQLGKIAGDEEYAAAALDAAVNEHGYCVADGYAYAVADTCSGYQIISWDDVGDVPEAGTNCSGIWADTRLRCRLHRVITEDGDPWEPWDEVVAKR